MARKPDQMVARYLKKCTGCGSLMQPDAFYENATPKHGRLFEPMCKGFLAGRARVKLYFFERGYCWRPPTREQREQYDHLVKRAWAEKRTQYEVIEDRAN